MQVDLKYLSISELVRALNVTLERSYPEIAFEGEVSQVTRAASGHVYLTLKDANSQIAAVVWRGVADGLDFALEQGLSLMCHGRPNVYQGSGRLQIVLHKLIPSGKGALQKKFLELKAKLEKEGLFDAQRKRALPFFPQAVGVVTSGTGAVIHDIMVKIKERMPSLKVYLLDVRVQGDGSAQEISAAIKQFSNSGLVDVIIVARGGGSLEDLWAFNEEVVVRAIFASKVPVVSGVGHEVDITLSDLVADLRAPTPTAAAELVVPRRSDLLKAINELGRRLNDVERWLQPKAQRLDDLALRLNSRLALALQQSHLMLKTSEAKLRSIQPQKVIETFKERLGFLDKRLTIGLLSSLKFKRAVLEKVLGRMEAVSPMRVLQRGYSLVEHNGKLVSSAESIQPGDTLDLSFFKGKARTKVLEKNNA